MGYYIRVLSTSDRCIPLQQVEAALKASSLKAAVKVEDGTPENWEQLTLAHKDGREIALIERNAVLPGELGQEEISEFIDEISDCQPESGSEWLNDYLHKVKTIYALQVLSGTDHKNGWEIFGAVKDCLWNWAPSIIQADGEGFTNEEGYHILWQFSDSVSGPWWMAVLIDNEWACFQMELGNQEHRAAFFGGRVPSGVAAS